MNDERRDHDAHAASELRHRVANTLQLMSALARMRSQRAGEPEARRQLLWMAEAIGSLGALERHRGEGGVDFSAYLKEMVPVWRRRKNGSQAEINLKVDAILAPDQAASTLALIVQELVTNALTHGYPDGQTGVVELQVSRNAEGRYELVVADDGCGFDPASPAARERFGLWFVRSLAAQVRGEFSIVCSPSVTARLTFSL
jgi:two-component sensor histidine kinase